jgi:predicted permease
MLDLKLAVRSLLRRPWALASVVLSLALAIAVQSVVTSVVAAVLWTPLPVPAPKEMVLIYGHSRMTNTWVNLATPQLEALRDAGVFQDVSGFGRLQIDWQSDGVSEPLNAEIVGDNYFAVVQPPLHMGRPPSEMNEVVVSHGFWMDRLGAEGSVIGRTITIEHRPFIVTGVMDRRYRGPLLDFLGDPKVWLPLRAQPNLPMIASLDLRHSWTMPFFVGIGRLKAGVGVGEAQQAVASFESNNPPPANAIPRQAALFSAEGATFQPGTRASVTGILRFCSLLATLMVGLACLNAGFVSIVKALGEARQIAVMRALGAGTMRRFAQTFVEALLICGAVSVIGAALAFAGMGLLRRYPPPLAHLVVYPELSWQVWTTALVSVCVAVLSMAVAAILASGRMTVSLQSRDMGPSRKFQWVRTGLIAGQLFVVVMFLVASTIVFRSIAAAHAVPLGFDVDGLTMTSLEFNDGDPRAATWVKSAHAVVDLLRARPEVESATVSSLMPLASIRRPGRVRWGQGARGGGAAAGAGDAATAGAADLPVFSNAVGASYFETLRLPLLAGRGLLAGTGGANEIVINETLARRIGARDVPGGTLDILDERGQVVRRVTVVGVARDARYHSLWQADIPFMYESLDARPGGAPAIIVRSNLPHREIAEIIRREAIGVAPTATVGKYDTVGSRLAVLTREQTWLWSLLSVMTGLALVVAIGGLVVNLQLMVTLRFREIAIRQAVGATPRSVAGQIFRWGMVVVAPPLAMALIAGFVLQDWIKPLTPGVSSGDPWPSLFSAAVVLTAALIATLGPMRRALGIDLVSTLRDVE